MSADPVGAFAVASDRKTLRPYQVRLVTDVGRVAGDVLVEQPTGSGKTVQIVTLVAMHLGRRFSHAVISAPQEQIEQGFVERDYRLIDFPEHRGVAVPSIQAPNEEPHRLIKGARDSGIGAVSRVVQYLRQPGPLDHAFACTHAALNRPEFEKNLPQDLSGKSLFIDEAHHASADGLSRVVALWRERGGQLFFFTATPYRGDGRPVRLDGMRSFRRSLAEHMAEGFAPRHLESEIVALGQPGDAITAGQFTGEEAPPASYTDGLVAAIVRRWLDDGRPKTIVRVPPMRGGKSGELVVRLTKALAAHGAPVLDATGTGTADKRRFLSGLDAEKGRTHATSAFDVMVGIQRVLEGTDWPVCSAVYCVGMPGSLNTVVQFLGRAMRLKGEDYPAAQRDRARLVFFVPCGGGSALADLSIDHSRHALLTCCFLADHEVGQEWIVTQEVRRGIEAALGSRDENPAVADAENEADEPLDPETRAEVELAIAGAREQITDAGGEPTLGAVVEATAKSRPDLPEAAVQRVAAEILAAQTTNVGVAARQTIQQEVARRLRIDPKVKRAMTEAFAVVLEEFRDATLRDSAVLASVGRQVHGVTGGQMREFAQRLRDAVPRPLTEEMIFGWADAHFARTETWPRVDSGDILDTGGETWADVDRALRRSLRGLSGGTSLPQLLAKNRGARNQSDLEPLTVGQILAWADAHHDRIGQWPGKESGPVLDAPGETWSGVNAALTSQLRGITVATSLAQLLAEKRAVRNQKRLDRLTEIQILKWADAHREKTGDWPRKDSGAIADAPAETWIRVDGNLREGNRGFPGGSSLARFLDENRAVRNHLALPTLTEDQILQWADSFHARTGKWPRVKSGVIDDSSGQTWAGVDLALRNAIRNLPGGSSLAQLIANKRGVPNEKNLPPLTEEQILAWADRHYRTSGEWPKNDSGPIVDAPGETWLKIDSALRRGGRSLPSRSSLPRLLSEHRGVRNLADLAPLTEEQIVQWAEAHRRRTGAYPHGNSGAIAESPGDTWIRIDRALRRGFRTLPGGSALIHLIRHHRQATPQRT